MNIMNTLIPYATIPYEGIQYGVCREFNHVSRYRNLRRITHNPDSDRFVTLELVNAFESQTEVYYHTVTEDETNRLDLIAYTELGDATYSWILAYLNNIEDGFTINSGQVLMIPKSFTSLFNKHELLAPINPTSLNLGEE